MTFDIHTIAASKEARRKRIAALPYGEKLRILDQMRARDLTIGNAKQSQKTRPGGTGSQS